MVVGVDCFVLFIDLYDNLWKKGSKKDGLEHMRRSALPWQLVVFAGVCIKFSQCIYRVCPYIDTLWTGYLKKGIFAAFRRKNARSVRKATDFADRL
jgi:hypothetical protein